MATCKTCQLAARSQIDALLAAGASVRSVARMFEIPRTSLTRHAQHAQQLRLRDRSFRNH